MWFRRDLRCQDNPALFAACKQAPDGVIGLFIITPETWQNHAMASVQVDFLLKNLAVLSEELAKLNIPLLIREVPSFKEVPALIAELVDKIKIDALYFNRQYEWDERERDQAVIKKLTCTIHTFDDQVIIPPEKILNQQQEPFKVFTPFKRKWLFLAKDFYSSPLPRPKVQPVISCIGDPVPNSVKGFANVIPLPTAGEAAAIQRLRDFCKKQIDQYQTARDFPALDATSHLSAYLTLGVLSPRQCITRVMLEKNIGHFSDFSDKSGAAIWVSELIWREFYKMIMFHFPQVCKYQPFQAATKKLKWNNDKKLFARWCEGTTGFPLVDAAMRQLKQTGWMHNRLRMLTAMFLTKILFIDWRWGERYFSEHLIDCDFSANNGGWQWSASTGTDSVPYFRIFNPITQSERFDANGDFIRQFCPELSALDAKTIHDPFERRMKNTALDYPEKIVDYKTARGRTLHAFKSLK